MTLAVLMAVGAAYRPALLVMLTAGGSIALIVAAIVTKHEFVSAMHWMTIILCFYVGVIFYHFRFSIPITPWLVGLAVAGWLIAVYGPPIFGVLLGPISSTYLVCRAGMMRLPERPLIMPGDYSYGIFLYGFPIQQFVLWCMSGHSTWYENFTISFPITTLLAIVSWHWVESPALNLRKMFSQKTRLQAPRAIPGP